MGRILIRLTIVSLVLSLSKALLWSRGLTKKNGAESTCFRSFPIDKTENYVRSSELDTTDITVKGLVSLDLYCCQKETQPIISEEISNWMQG